MRKFRAAASTLALAGVLALSACEHGNFVFYSGVTVGPPPLRVIGPVGPMPGSGWVWTDGFYTWVGNGWVWQPGRWQRPPHPGWVWRPPYYRRHGSGFRMYQGVWVRR